MLLCWVWKKHSECISDHFFNKDGSESLLWFFAQHACNTLWSLTYRVWVANNLWHYIFFTYQINKLFWKFHKTVYPKFKIKPESDTAIATEDICSHDTFSGYVSHCNHLTHSQTIVLVCFTLPFYYSFLYALSLSTQTLTRTWLNSSNMEL